MPCRRDKARYNVWNCKCHTLSLSLFPSGSGGKWDICSEFHRIFMVSAQFFSTPFVRLCSNQHTRQPPRTKRPRAFATNCAQSLCAQSDAHSSPPPRSQCDERFRRRLHALCTYLLLLRGRALQQSAYIIIYSTIRNSRIAMMIPTFVSLCRKHTNTLAHNPFVFSVNVSSLVGAPQSGFV